MRNLKAGRFVNTPHGVGVFLQVVESGEAEVHLIDKNGETVSEKLYKLEDIKPTDKALPTRKAIKKEQVKPK